MKDGKLIAFKVAAETKCYAGGIAALKSGYCQPGKVETGLIAVGCFDETVDNGSGAAGDKEVRVRVGNLFQLQSAGSDDAIAQADVGSDCYIVDDQTVRQGSRQ